MMLNTNHKIQIARTLSGLVVGTRRALGLAAEVKVTRGGFNWELDLKEGIDLAIYLLGGFEVRTLRLYRRLVKAGDIILDIGANIGAHTMPLARLVGETGMVVAFEPTKYAYTKLIRNAALNPELGPRIAAWQMMLVGSETDSLPDAIYSSWPLESSSDLHSAHQGRLMPTEGAAVSTLDGHVRRHGLQKIDFIKLDVDGNEFDVLSGGQQTLARFRPTLMMELAPYVYERHPHKFDDTLKLLWDSGYVISEVSNGRELPRDPARVRRLIPPLGGMNALATARKIAPQT
jgi:FkbM family methyltransferase